MMKFTPAQREAIYTHDRNVIVVAGAGSGKTSVLVNRYLALLDAHPDWSISALVAITFTQKAAQEMRDRVRQEIEKRLAIAGDDAERVRWQAHVKAMDSARIDTIHGLCTSILRANAAEAGVDPGFDVLDEVDSRILLNNVIDDVLRDLVAENDSALRLFSEYNSGNEVRRVLVDWISADLPDIPDGVMAAWEMRREQDAKDAVAAFLSAGFARWQPVDDKGLSAAWQDCNDIFDQLAIVHTLDEQLAVLQSLGGMRIPAVSSAWGEDGAAAKADFTTIRDAAKAIIADYGSPLTEHDQRAAELVPLWGRLIKRVQDAYRHAKQVNSLMDFDDLETRTRQLLHNFPDVRARYQQNEFKHLLVDEFQDTNAAQWEIICSLADPRQPGSLFLVGDARQSIYQFRGADVSVFERVRAELEALGGVPVTMAESFRTHQKLVDCFNDLFAQVLVREDGDIAATYQITLGEPMQAARIEAPCDDPVVEFLLVDKPDESDGSKTEDGRRAEAARLASRIVRLVDHEKRPVFDKEKREHRPVEYRDVAVLFQAMTSVTIYEEALKAAGVPYVTIAGRGYYDRQEVWDLINLLRALYNPADNLSLAAALHSPMFNLSDDALLGLRLIKDTLGKPVLLWDALSHAAYEPVSGIANDEQDKVTFAHETLFELRLRAGRVTIAELLRDALDRTGYLATLTGLPDGARRRGNVEKLLDKAQESGKVTLGAFSQYLDDLSAQEAREGEAALDAGNAVKLMTVHKSKGLEFPVVALADVSRRPVIGGGGLLATDAAYGLVCKVVDPDTGKQETPFAYKKADKLRQGREEAERRRLLYVAATRAQDALLVSGQVKPSKKDGTLNGDGWMKWLLKAFDLNEIEPAPRAEYERAWGKVRVLFPEDDEVGVDDTTVGVWETSIVKHGELAGDGDGIAPPLVATVEPRYEILARSLTKQELADLSSMRAARGVDKEAYRFYRLRLRRRLFYDAPHYIKAVIPAKALSPRVLGDIVHRALRAWRFPSETDDLDAILRAYAWEEGVVRPEDLTRAVSEARDLLYRTMQSDLYRWLKDAPEVYRDLPFVFSHDRQLINGVLDVLFRRADGTWGMVDYKTVHVPDAEELPEAVAAHAPRFALQVGVAAAAVSEQLSELAGHPVVPDVFIHYIRYSQTVALPTSEWQAALQHLEDDLDELVRPHDSTTVRTATDVGAT